MAAPLRTEPTLNGQDTTMTTISTTSGRNTTGRASATTVKDAHRQTDAALKLTFTGVLRMEWIKLVTLRSTYYMLAGTLVVLVGFGAIAAAVDSGAVDPAQGTGPGSGAAAAAAGGSVLTTVLAGVNLAVLVVGILGVLVAAREYGSGMIRTTLAAVPARLPVLWAKALVIAVVTFVVTLVGVSIAFVVGNAILDAGGSETLAIGDSGVLTALVGEAGYMTAMALVGLGLGFLLRDTAGSIATLVGGLFVLPGLGLLLLPASWQDSLEFLPSNAADSMTSLVEGEYLTNTQGLLVIIGWVVAAVVAAAVALRSRDA